MVSKPANRFHAGGDYFCREPAGNFMGPTRPLALDYVDFVRTAGGGDWSAASAAAVENGGPAIRPGSSDSSDVGSTARCTARPSPERYYDRSEQSRRQRAYRSSGGSESCCAHRGSGGTTRDEFQYS